MINPYAAPNVPADDRRACALCGQRVVRRFSPFQRVRCERCGCQLALKLSMLWTHTLTLALVAGWAALGWLSTGILQTLLLGLGILTLYLIVFNLVIAVAGQLWPVHEGVFVSRRELEAARHRFHSAHLGSEASRG